MKSSRISQAIVAAGGSFIALGYLSPWAVVDPNHEGPVADIKFWRQNVAFELDYLQADVLTLLPLVLTAVLLARNPKSRVAQAVGLLSGMFYIALPFYYRTNMVALHHMPTDIIYSVMVGGILILAGVGFTISRVSAGEINERLLPLICQMFISLKFMYLVSRRHSPST